MAELGAQKAMAGRLRCLGLGPLGPAPTAGTLSIPPKKFTGVVREYQEPSGAKHTGQDRTGQPSGLDKQDKTAHRNRKPSWARLEAEASSGHDEESGALTGSLSYRFHFCDRRGRRLALASMATTRGTACPRRVSADKTRQGKFKMFLWAQQDINTALLAGTCGLDPRGLSQWLACVSGGPAA